MSSGANHYYIDLTKVKRSRPRFLLDPLLIEGITDNSAIALIIDPISGLFKDELKIARRRARGSRIATCKSGIQQGWVWAVTDDEDKDGETKNLEGVEGVRFQNVTPLTPSEGNGKRNCDDSSFQIAKGP